MIGVTVTEIDYKRIVKEAAKQPLLHYSCVFCFAI